MAYREWEFGVDDPAGGPSGPYGPDWSAHPSGPRFPDWWPGEFIPEYVPAGTSAQGPPLPPGYRAGASSSRSSAFIAAAGAVLLVLMVGGALMGER